MTAVIVNSQYKSMYDRGGCGLSLSHAIQAPKRLTLRFVQAQTSMVELRG
jgi:hypothetical protein